MNKIQIFGWVFVAGGLVAVGGGALNVDAFMDSPKAEPFVKALGRTGARLFYIVVGLAMMAFGGLIVSWNSAAGD